MAAALASRMMHRPTPATAHDAAAPVSKPATPTTTTASPVAQLPQFARAALMAATEDEQYPDQPAPRSVRVYRGELTSALSLAEEVVAGISDQ